MTFDEWLEVGRKNFWISEVRCEKHEGIPYSEAEIEADNADEELCIHILRVYKERNKFEEVENNLRPCKDCGSLIDADIFKEELGMCVECSHIYFDHKEEQE